MVLLVRCCCLVLILITFRPPYIMSPQQESPTPVSTETSCITLIPCVCTTYWHNTVCILCKMCFQIRISPAHNVLLSLQHTMCFYPSNIQCASIPPAHNVLLSLQHAMCFYPSSTQCASIPPAHNVLLSLQHTMCFYTFCTMY